MSNNENINRETQAASVEPEKQASAMVDNQETVSGAEAAENRTVPAAKPEAEPFDVEKVLKPAIKFIENNSKNGKFTVAADIKKQFNLSDENLTKTIAELKETEHIVELADGDNKYMYSRNKMYDTYAYLLIKLINKDYISIIVETVRRESKIFPNPTWIPVFKMKPYNLTQEELDELVKQIIDNREEYADIEHFIGYDGHPYFVSTKFMSLYWAKVWVEEQVTADP